ncbi:MAG TPA: hypothetical protein VKP14_10835 [Gaiellaceae bacterium]|nr:hypothetical protein [Gaiellaceae bacterium]
MITQRRALGFLFFILAALVLAAAAAALVGAGHDTRRWIVGLAAIAVAWWLGSLAFASLRPRR